MLANVKKFFTLLIDVPQPENYPIASNFEIFSVVVSLVLWSFSLAPVATAQKTEVRHLKHKPVTHAKPNCPLCQNPPGNLHHCICVCPARDFFIYPLSPYPSCPLQKRLRWPLQIDETNDHSIIDLFRKIRNHFLSLRWDNVSWDFDFQSL